MNHHLKCLHSLQRQGEKQKYENKATSLWNEVAMNHHLKCLHSLQRQGEKQKYENKKYNILLETKYKEINIIRIN